MANQYEQTGSGKEGLRVFTNEERQIIEQKRRVLSSLAFFIGKDFKIPVELNEPGKGWHWDFQNNVIRVDPIDMLEKPMDYLRFVISHEGGHRRISRAGFIPKEQWQKLGFSFMMNAIEDPRDNNFVAENYPKFKDWMDMAYNLDLAIEMEAKEKANSKLGFQSRFMQAGFEYIRLWFKDSREEELSLSSNLPEEVKDVVEKTMKAAQDSWWKYPSRQEADSGEENIEKYAKESYRINLTKIWPEFQKLIEQDKEDQKLQEFLKGQDGEPSPGGEGEGKLVPLDQLSDEQKEKLREQIEALPEETKKDLQERAEKALEEFSKEISKALEVKLKEGDKSQGEAEKSDGAGETGSGKSDQSGEEQTEQQRHQNQEAAKEDERKAQEEYQKVLQEINEKDRGVYDQYRQEIMPIIDHLEQDLREIFVARKTHLWETGFLSGKRINLKRRIQEKAKGIPAIESKAWQRRELPAEKDYSITLLVDLSGSMRGEKIKETFKAVIVLTEVLNKLSISLEVLGFNKNIYEYQRYGEGLNQEKREQMATMLSEVNSGAAKYNDDGWALGQASERLAKQKGSEKILITLSDGEPEESPDHSGGQYSLDAVVEKIAKETNQKLIGLGIGADTGHVDKFYPTSLSNVALKEMAEKLSELIKTVIEDPGNM